MVFGGKKVCKIKKKVITCCCCKKGDITIKAFFDRGDYKSGDVATIIAEIDNSLSSKVVKKVTASFSRYFSYKANGYTKKAEYDLKSFVLEGIKAKEKCVGEQAKKFQIPIGSNDPSCSGKLISNSYSLEVKAKMEGCQCNQKSPVAITSINIYNKPGEKLEFVAPPGWKPTIMNSFVCNLQTDSPAGNDGYLDSSIDSENSMLNPPELPKSIAKTNI